MQIDDFGSIHNARMKMGLSHKKLSELSGVDVKTIREIEYGTVDHPEDYGKLVKALAKEERKSRRDLP